MMATNRPEDDPRDELPPAEAARARRRDHDASAGARAGMRTGLAKQFKQVLDAQARWGRKAGAPRATQVPRDAPDEADRPDRPSVKRPWRRRGEP